MNARGHAEKAVLGAILTDPSQLTGLAEWLSSEDFAAPQHAELYRAMLILDERDATPDLTNTSADERAQATTTYSLELLTYVTGRDTKLDPTYLHELMQACPRPEHAPYYGRMVVEADTHRTIIENATRLAQIAHDHPESPFGLEHLFVHTAAFRQVIDHLADRWGLTADDLTHDATTHATADRTASGPMPASASTSATDATLGAGPHVATFADQLAPELDAPPTAEQQAAAADREDTLLACILRSPTQLDQVRAYLTPDDFTALGRGALYQAALDIHTRGDPVDPVTLIWEAQAIDQPAPDNEASQASQLTGDDLMRLHGDGLPAEVAPYYARQILEQSILTTTTQAARDLKTLASNPHLTATDLIPAAAHRIDQLKHDEDRWTGISASQTSVAEPPNEVDDPRTAEASSDRGHAL